MRAPPIKLIENLDSLKNVYFTDNQNESPGNEVNYRNKNNSDAETAKIRSSEIIQPTILKPDPTSLIPNNTSELPSHSTNFIISEPENKQVSIPTNNENINISLIENPNPASKDKSTTLSLYSDIESKTEICHERIKARYKNFKECDVSRSTAGSISQRNASKEKIENYHKSKTMSKFLH